MNRELKIFLASSAELEDDRKAFKNFIGSKNNELNKDSQFIKLVIWEDFIDRMSRTNLQDEYNKAAKECDIFIILFATKVGQYTLEEFEAAFGQFQQSGRPWIYTYFKRSNVDYAEIDLDDLISVRKFQDRLKELGHFWSNYSNSSDLLHHFNMQLEKDNPFSDGLQSQPLAEGELGKQQTIRNYCMEIKRDFSTINLFGEGSAGSTGDPRLMRDIDKGFVPLHLKKRSDISNSEQTSSPDTDELFLGDDPLQRHFILRGLPGSGKTTLLRYLTHRFACTGSEGEKEHIPVYMRCREFSSEFRAEDSIEKLIERQINSKCKTKSCHEILMSDDCFLETPMVLLFDGLDEIEDEAVDKRFRKELVRLKEDHPRCRIIVTSRPVKLNEKEFLSFRHLELLPLEDEMIYEYIGRWFGHNSDNVDLFKEIFKRQARIKALASNPFLLSMICFTYERGGDTALIERRSELYKNCTEYLLERRYDLSGKPKPEADYERLIDLLKHIALRFFLWNESNFPVDHVNVMGRDIPSDESVGNTADSLDDVERQTGLIQRTRDGFTFVHRSLWEYFTALALKDKPLKFTIKYAANPDWEEVVRLYAGLLTEAETASLIEGLWNINRPLALRVTTEVKMLARELVKPLIEKEGDNRSKMLLIDSLEQSLPLVPVEEQNNLIDETLTILLIDCEERDCEVIYQAEQLLGNRQMHPLKPGGLIYRLLELEDAGERQKKLLNDLSGVFEWIEVKGGTFLMGDNENNEDERPAHKVKVSTFYISKTAVTNRHLSLFPFPFGERYPNYMGAGENHPAIGNTWWEAYYFALWMGAKLPTEAQWEYAARGGHKSPIGDGEENIHIGKYRYAGSDDSDQVSWHYENSEGKAHSVSEKETNELGLYDMSGNVWKWCADWYGEGYYETCEKAGLIENPVGPETGSYRVLRGGCWNDYARYCRCADRDFASPSDRNNTIGFRLVFVP